MPSLIGRAEERWSNADEGSLGFTEHVCGVGRGRKREDVSNCLHAGHVH